MKKKYKVKADAAGVSEAVEFVEGFLKDYKIKHKDLLHTLLTVEESVGSLVQHAKEDCEISIRLKAFLGTVTIELSCKGEEYSLVDNVGMTGSYDDSELEGAQEMLRNLMLRSFANNLKYRNSRGINYIRMTLVRTQKAFLYQTLGAMVLGIAAGLFMAAFTPEGFNSLVNDYMFDPVKTMYMNALKMIVAPVVFFSIVSCIVRFSDLTELGRLGARVLSLYFFTSCAAVAVGIGSYYLFSPGNSFNAMTMIADPVSITSNAADVSIKDLIVNIVPSNFIQPFIDSNMLQLIFLAVLCGIAAGLIGKYSEMIKSIFEAFNDLFLKITGILIKAMPVAVFCANGSMMLSTGIDTIVSLLGMFGTFVFGLVMMMLLYSFMIVIIARINPVNFIRKYAPTMLQVFSLASSNASIPLNLEACDNIGIAKKIYSLSIPIGATLNMDGACVHLAVFGLALANTFGIPVTGSALTGMIITILVLSIGAPGVPGAGLICMSVLFAQMNIPAEAMGIVIGIDAFAGMFRTMSNCLGDVAVSVIVAKRENALDMEKYNA